jgi:copper oxidase (laccase) domain-containing protein
MKLLVALSTIIDGNMLIAKDQSDTKVIQNRTDFLASHRIAMANTTRLKIIYEGNDYCRYYEVANRHKRQGMFNDDGIAADALVTQEPGHALFLPLADCVGAAIYDPIQHILMVSHLGRHSLEQNGGYNCIDFLIKTYSCDPSKLLVWLTPAPGQQNYPLFAFNNRAVKDVVFEQLQTAGILTQNITDDPTDTTNDTRYYSHSEFLRGNRTEDGRYALVAVINN